MKVIIFSRREKGERINRFIIFVRIVIFEQTASKIELKCVC